MDSSAQWREYHMTFIWNLDWTILQRLQPTKKVSAGYILHNDHQLIQDLGKAGTYKYPGMEEGEGVQCH